MRVVKGEAKYTSIHDETKTRNQHKTANILKTTRKRKIVGVLGWSNVEGRRNHVSSCIGS